MITRSHHILHHSSTSDPGIHIYAASTYPSSKKWAYNSQHSNTSLPVSLSQKRIIMVAGRQARLKGEGKRKEKKGP